MSHNILITGGSGYLGGTLLARWKSANLPQYNTLYAFVRTEEQARKVKQYGAEPLTCNISDHEQLTRAIIDKKITVVYFLIDAYWDTHQKVLIKALGEVKKQTGEEVHFLHTAGAKHFSRHAGIYFDEPLLDTDPKLYDIQKTAVSPHDWFSQVWNVSSYEWDRSHADVIRELGCQNKCHSD